MKISIRVRANRALAALLAHEEVWFKTGDQYRETIYDSLMAYPDLRISELVSELHHLADAHGLDWEEVLKVAQNYHSADVWSESREKEELCAHQQ